MADSLHDSLTDTHRPGPLLPSYQEATISRCLDLQNVGELERLAGGGQQGGDMSLQSANWLNDAPPVHDTRSSEQEHNPRIANGIDIDEDPPKSWAGSVNSRSRSSDELLVGASSVQCNAAPVVQDQQLDTKLKEEEQRRREFPSDIETSRQEEQAVGDLDVQQAQSESEIDKIGQTSIQANTSPQDVPPEVAAFITNEGTREHDSPRKRDSRSHDSVVGDGQSLADNEGQSDSGAAMPHQGGPSITHSEALDALEQAEQGVEVGGGSSDDGYETDSNATSQSLATSARQFIFEHGRRYHSYKADINPYLFPNDDREQDREDLKHAMFLKLFNKTLHFAPVPAIGANVLDLGTGTGIWAVDFADLYPSASVLGIDLSPIQTVWVPPNLKFMVDDAEAEWLHPANFFDLIHTRHMIQAFRKWPNIFECAFTHLRPGAWMECQELDHVPQCSDGTMAEDNPMLAYWLYIVAGLKTLGVDFRLAPSLASMMRAAGFVNVTERVFITPIGPWPKNRALKEVGMYWRATLMEGIEAIALGPMIRGLGWKKDEVEVFIAGVRKAYLETSKETHAWMPFYIVYGQKPYNA